MTALDLIVLALRQAGVNGIGQDPSAEDANDSLKLLNAMIGQWAVRRWLVYALRDVTLTSTGALSYTYGPGGDFDQPSTDHLEAAFFRFLKGSGPQQPDYPLRMLNSWEDWSRIRLKTLSTWPQYVFFDGNYPLASVNFWPIPQAEMYELHLVVKTPLEHFDSLPQEIVLPPAYQEALLYNLGLRLRTHFQLDPDPQLAKLAADSLQTLRMSNAQIPRLTLDTVPRSSGWYNVYADRTN